MTTNNQDKGSRSIFVVVRTWVTLTPRRAISTAIIVIIAIMAVVGSGLTRLAGAISNAQSDTTSHRITTNSPAATDVVAPYTPSTNVKTADSQDQQVAMTTITLALNKPTSATEIPAWHKKVQQVTSDTAFLEINAYRPKAGVKLVTLAPQQDATFTAVLTDNSIITMALTQHKVTQFWESTP